MIARLFNACWWALTAVQTAWIWPNLALASMLALPLVAMGIGLLRPTPRRRAAASLLSLPYFALGTTEWAVEQSLHAAGVVTLCTLLYLLIVADNVRSRRSH